MVQQIPLLGTVSTFVVCLYLSAVHSALSFRPCCTASVAMLWLCTSASEGFVKFARQPPGGAQPQNVMHITHVLLCIFNPSWSSIHRPTANQLLCSCVALSLTPCLPHYQVTAAGPADMRMYYHSYDARLQRFVIGLATSPDGFRWTKQGPVFDGSLTPGAHDEKGAGACHVVSVCGAMAAAP